MNIEEHVTKPLVTLSDLSDDGSDDCSHQQDTQLLKSKVPCNSNSIKDLKLKSKGKPILKSTRKSKKGPCQIGCCGICVRKGRLRVTGISKIICQIKIT